MKTKMINIKEIQEEIQERLVDLEKGVKYKNWVSVYEHSTKISNLTFMLSKLYGKVPYNVVEAINNSASLHQAECPICYKPFTREDTEGYYTCSNCGSKVHYNAFTVSELFADDLGDVDDGK